MERNPGDRDNFLLEACASDPELRRTPENAAGYHNLGANYARMGRPGEAVDAYRESLRLRPNYPPTLLLLGHALEACGRSDEARQVPQIFLTPGRIDLIQRPSREEYR